MEGAMVWISTCINDSPVFSWDVKDLPRTKQALDPDYDYLKCLQHPVILPVIV